MSSQNTGGSDSPSASPGGASPSEPDSRAEQPKAEGSQVWGRWSSGTPAEGGKPRSKVERAIVWGTIGVLLVIVAIEGWSYLGFKRAHSRLQAELQKAEETDYRITRERVTELMGNRSPDESHEVTVASAGDKRFNERYDLYHFKGLLRDRTLCVHYGVPGKMDEPEVIEVTTIIPDEIL